MKKTDRKLSSKIQYIWDYYKVPLFIAALVIYIIGYIGFRYATHKDILLYIAAVNTPVEKAAEEYIRSFPESDHAAPDADASGERGRKNADVSLVKDLYLVSDPDSEREAMDAFAAQGFLMPLESVFSDDPQILERLETGNVILEDNHLDVLFD